MKNPLLLIFTTLSILYCGHGFAQSGVKELEIPAESIYLHQNTTFLMSGENLFYTVYCLNNETGKLSDLSKMAYVELIGQDGKAVFSHKVRLEQGKGNGDYFVPTSVASGNYKLLAFTRWMQNGPVENFYQNDVIVINPFQNNQNGLLRSDSDSPQLTAAPSTSKGSQMDETPGIDLELTPSIAGQRENITVSLKGISPGWYGNYSLSVRKIFDLPQPARTSASSFQNSNKATARGMSIPAGQSVILPELRGELLSGTVVDKATGEPSAKRKVALSIPGTNYLFKISNSGDDGRFHFNLDQPYSNEKALIQVIGDDRDSFGVEMDAFQSPDYSNLKFNDFAITSEMESAILEHSVNNQVQNAYAVTRLDSVADTGDFPPFYNAPSHEYNLDDYTRFPTIRETIIEIIEQASIRQRKGQQFIHVRVYDDDVESGLSSLLLIDGLFIQDHNTVVEAKASKIKKVSVINEQYLYGSELFEGIISMESYEGDFIESLPQLKGRETDLFRPELAKKYHKQDYRYQERYKRIPDFRTQLAWEPNFQLNDANTVYSFYTSDLSGTFELVLEGFNSEGKALSLKKVFEVRPGSSD